MTRVQRTSNTLETEVETYLGRLARAVPDSTYASHKTTLQKFTKWYSDKDVSRQLDESLVAAFSATSLSNYSLTTVRGYIDTIANFLGYYHQTDPELVKIRIATHLERKETSEDRNNELRLLISTLQPATVENELIKTIISEIDQYRYGTRLHSFVRLVLDTKGRPELIRQLDLKDLDSEAKTVEISIPKTHTVRKIGLVNTRVASLSYPTREVLNTYVRYERNEVGKGTHPLFTTAHGRMSESTLRHSLKRVCEKIMSEELHQPILPIDIWQYAISQIA